MEEVKPVCPGALINLPAMAKVTSPTFIESPAFGIELQHQAFHPPKLPVYS